MGKAKQPIFLRIFPGSALRLCFCFCWFEVLLRADISTRFWGTGLLFSLLFAIAAGLALAGLCRLLPVCGARVCENILLGAVFFLFAAQSIYYAVFKTYFTFFSAGHGGQVLQFIDVICTTLMQKGSFLLLLALPLWGGALARALRPRPVRKAALYACGFSALMGVLLYGLALSLLVFTAHSTSAYALYFEKRVMNDSVQELGLITTMRHDLGDLLFGFTESDAVNAAGVTIADGAAGSGAQSVAEPTGIAGGENSTDADDAAESTATPVVREAQVLDNVDFAALAETQTGTAAEISRYIAGAEPTYTNEMTGLFAGKNLIYIVAESFSHYVIDETRTPTLYKMQQQGFNFTNFYTGAWGVSTLDGEYVALTGLVPQQNVWSLFETRYGSMPFTLASFLKRQGYSTYAYHNGLYDYYSRNLSHPNLGYDSWKGVGNGLSMTNEWPRSDEELIDITTEDYIHDAQFHVYYLTISGHLPYTFGAGDAMATKNADAVADLPYSTPVKAYLAANIELDKAMALLLQRLEEAGKLEDTVIVLSGDHYPYGLTNAEISELAGHTVDTAFELYKNTLLIYNAGTAPQTVAKAASSLDIMPTVCNLFGLDYDSRIFSGRDIFSDSSPLVFLVSRSFITDKVMYNAETNTATPLNGATVTEEYINEMAQLVSDKFRYARQILGTYYYDTLPPEAFTSNTFTRGNASVSLGSILAAEVFEIVDNSSDSAA